MKLSEITSSPKLIEVTIDDEATVTEFGEALTFYTWDRQPMDVFMRIANASGGDQGALIDIVRTLILSETGKQILNDKNMLPTNILMKAIGKVTEQLGK
jgi:hypothetical protein